MTDNAKTSLTVFISSTFIDLQDYRDAARAAINGLRYHASDMIHWSADEREPAQLSLDELRESDLVILIVAHRYGTVPPGETRSITEIEFDESRRLRKRVLAFLIDDNHDWPGSRFDVKQYDRLLSFKEKVKRHCSPKSFTTRDNLAALVTQAVVNYDRRHRPWIESPPGWEPPFSVNPISSIDQSADTVIPIGKAEDGLLLALSVHRSDNLNQQLTEIVKGLESLQEVGIRTQAEHYFRGLLSDAESVWRRRGIQEVEVSPGSTARCYVTKSTLTALFSDSLLSRLLTSPAIHDRSLNLDNKIGTRVLEDSSRQFPTRIQSISGQNRFLGISPDLLGQLFVVGKAQPNQNAESQFLSWHTFIDEAIDGFMECSYTIYKNEVLSHGALKNYGATLSKLYERHMDDDGKSEIRVIFEISRRSIGETIVGILDCLQNEFHRQDLVHGDVKPKNCLLTAKRVMLIDSLDLQIGEISPALTPIWAAPEQLAIRPVLLATDVFPIGLMVTELLSGQLVGEIASYRIPAVRGGGSDISFVRNPLIYFGSDNFVVSSSARRSWQEFIEKCLRFDPSERFANAEDCALALRDLLDRVPPEGSLTLDYERGRLQMLRTPDGQKEIFRIVDDMPYDVDDTVHGAAVKQTCHFCGMGAQSGLTFCRNCGLPLTPGVPLPTLAPSPSHSYRPTSSLIAPTYCRHCRAALRRGARFCGYCGRPVP